MEERRSGAKPRAAQRDAKIVALAASDKTIGTTAIATRLGVSPATVRRALRAAGAADELVRRCEQEGDEVGLAIALERRG